MYIYCGVMKKTQCTQPSHHNSHYIYQKIVNKGKSVVKRQFSN